MTRDEVLQAFCEMSTRVRDAKFDSAGNCSASDCFCGKNDATTRLNCFQFDAEIVEFIEQAVAHALGENVRMKRRSGRFDDECDCGNWENGIAHGRAEALREAAAFVMMWVENEDDNRHAHQVAVAIHNDEMTTGED